MASLPAPDERRQSAAEAFGLARPPSRFDGFSIAASATGPVLRSLAPTDVVRGPAGLYAARGERARWHRR